MTAAALHPGLTQERWRGLSLADQLANIGTEVARAARAKGKNDEVRLQQHLDLALELFEFTLDDERWRGQRVEIGRTREVVCDFLVGENEYESSAASLDSYFLPFTYLSLRAAAPSSEPAADGGAGTPLRTSAGRASRVTDPLEPSGPA